MSFIELQATQSKRKFQNHWLTVGFEPAATKNNIRHPMELLTGGSLKVKFIHALYYVHIQVQHVARSNLEYF